MLSAGIGVGMILHGRLYEGHSGTAGELGHVTVEPGGALLPLRRARLPGDGRRDAGAAARHRRRRVASTRCWTGSRAATAPPSAPSTRPARTSARPSPPSAASSTPRWSSSAATSPRAGEALLSPIRIAFAEWERPPELVLGTLGPEAEALGAAAAAMRTSATITQEHHQ